MRQRFNDAASNRTRVGQRRHDGVDEPLGFGDFGVSRFLRIAQMLAQHFLGARRIVANRPHTLTSQTAGRQTGQSDRRFTKPNNALCRLDAHVAGSAENAG